MKNQALLAALAATALPMPALACASCGCMLTADWLSQGLVAQPGTSFGLRYDYVPQTQLRADRDVVDRTTIALPTDREIEQYTYNHYVTATLDHQFASDWGVDVQVPFSYRAHATVDEGDIDRSYSHTGGLGDVRITARWQGLSRPGSITGIQFGVQLPTGRFSQTFNAGPDAGQQVDRGLQPGFGVTQAIAGIYRYGRLSGSLDYILQAQGQVPLYSRDAYRPGAIGQLSAGLHYTGWRGITPQLQVNFRVSGRDQGANADTGNTGGELLYLAPGAIVRLGGRFSAFTYVQVPVYQRLVGYQLAPKVTVSFGLQTRL